LRHGGASKRGLLNQDELDAVLIPAGWRIWDYQSSPTLRDRAEVLRETAHLMIEFGSDLVQSLFLTADATVHVLTTHDQHIHMYGDWDPRFSEKIIRLLGHGYVEHRITREAPTKLTDSIRGLCHGHTLHMHSGLIETVNGTRPLSVGMSSVKRSPAECLQAKLDLDQCVAAISFKGGKPEYPTWQWAGIPMFDTLHMTQEAQCRVTRKPGSYLASYWANITTSWRECVDCRRHHTPVTSGPVLT